ncbi:MAG: thioredoxin domain-containing protein [Ignavibacteria bacterium]|nr:thioredoxin domain-containing protein [Ignavibacteria bacterium]
MTKNQNNLIKEKSPYLLQHSGNPVKWNAWNEDSLNMAKELNKPIFLSIGYSTCYWCHVMERECFENEEIARLLNEYFVNIKVDREERPDIDRIYMAALQSMTGSGGWPMSIFLTPDLKPFYGATYIPPKAKYGRIGFEDLLKQINNLWNSKRNEIIESSDRIYGYMNKPDNNAEAVLSDYVFSKVINLTEEMFDEINGGFGQGNKFPRPALLNFLLTYFYATKDTSALDKVIFTLKKMYDGGIYDNIDKGFHRYSVDTYWRVPHFEKMLYDQAQISSIYFDAYMLTGTELFLNAGLETVGYVLNFLTSDEGGFYSAEDAESSLSPDNPSEKSEGFFYLWDKEEIDKILGKENSDIFCFRYGVMHSGNTISDPHEIFLTKNVLYKSADIFETSKKFGKEPDETEKILNSCLVSLKEHRDIRPRPFLDTKILTSWNAMMISSLTKAYSITREKKIKKVIIRATGFILNTMLDDEKGTIYHRFADGEKKHEGMLEDYALMIKALLDVYNITTSLKLLKKARKLIDITVEKFYDHQNGGFFDTEKGRKDLILRTKEIYDGAEPSGNSVMLENLVRAFIIFKDDRYYECADKTFRFFYNRVLYSPFSNPYYLHSLLCFQKFQSSFILTGDLNKKELEEMQELIFSKYHPNKNIIFYNKLSGINYLIDLIADSESIKVYYCENFTCRLPAHNKDELKILLNNI